MMPLLNSGGFIQTGMYQSIYVHFPPFHSSGSRTEKNEANSLIRWMLRKYSCAWLSCFHWLPEE